MLSTCTLMYSVQNLNTFLEEKYKTVYITQTCGCLIVFSTFSTFRKTKYDVLGIEDRTTKLKHRKHLYKTVYINTN